MGPETAQVAAVAAQNSNFLYDVANFFNQGGIFSYIVLATWILGVVIVVERMKSFHRWDVDGPSLMDMVKRNVLMNEVQKAIQTCSNSKSLLAYVLKSGLKRANQNKEQIQDAVESSILEVSPKLEKRMAQLALCSNISTLLGLLGTINGLIHSFKTLASADPSTKAKLLALGVSEAMNTTALGILSAVTLLVAHQILVGKSEKIQSEIDEFASKLVDLLGTKKHLPIAQPQETSNDENSSAA